MHEAEWKTRKDRIDTRLRASTPSWQVIPWLERLDTSRPTEDVWIFDARSNVPCITKKDRPLTAQHFTKFEKAYDKDPNGLSKRADAGKASRFRKFHISEIKERGYKLDVTRLKDDSLEDADELPEPQDLAAEAITELEAVVDDLREIVALVEKDEGVEK